MWFQQLLKRLRELEQREAYFCDEDEAKEKFLINLEQRVGWLTSKFLPFLRASLVQESNYRQLYRGTSHET